jgi:uncharacterized protein (TIGR01777 family)
MKKLIIAGGSGFLGQVLASYFSSRCEEIIIFSRNPKPNDGKIRYVTWDAQNLGAWTKELDGADALINLTGKSVDCRYNAKNKAEILRSRLDSTNILNEAIHVCVNPPKHFINSSTATIYEHSLRHPNGEANGIIGDDFSMNVAKQWEAVFFEKSRTETIKTALRTSIVLGNAGGAFPKMKQITALGLGGKQGNGQQMISWIHTLDYARSIEFILDKQLTGVINVTAPHPVSNEDFMKNLRHKLGAKLGLNSPKFLLEIGAFFMRTETELLLKSRFVLPQRLLSAGFIYQFGTLDSCLGDLTG